MEKRSAAGYLLMAFGMVVLISNAVVYLGRLTGTLELSWVPHVSSGIGAVFFIMGIYLSKMLEKQHQKK